ncbi:MAG TPA: Yip1 family protein, partial [Burkholderiaceae bacterium]
MALVQRIQDILLKPTTTWPVIALEPGDTASLYKNYIALIALVPAVAGFIGLSLVGVGGFGYSLRVPLVTGLVNMVVGYVLSLVMVFVLALIVDALAPTFGGTKNQANALKLVGYGATAGFLGGIFNLFPALSILGLLAALYSVYLIYTGLPVLMRCPQDKAIAYTAVVIVCGIVAGVVIGAVTRLASPAVGFGNAGGGGGDVSITTPGGEVKLDTAKMEAFARKMEEAGRQMEKAQAAGDSAAANQAAAAMMGAVAGGGGTPIPPQDLKALLPERIGGLQRESFEAQGGTAMGIAGSSAKGVFTEGERRVQLSITDIGGMGGLMGVAAWAAVTIDRETDGRVEKVYRQGKRTVREEYRKDGSQGD